MSLICGIADRISTIMDSHRVEHYLDNREEHYEADSSLQRQHWQQKPFRISGMPDFLQSEIRDAF